MNADYPLVGIRRATVDDAGQVSELLGRAFAAYARLYTRAGYAATTPSADRVRERFAEGPTWLAETDVVIGTVSAVNRLDGVYVRSMAVLPSVRGRGTGRALMREVERFAIATRARRMYLSTTPFLFEAIRLYESLGFRRTGAPPHDLFGTPLVTMEKRF